MTLTQDTIASNAKDYEGIVTQETSASNAKDYEDIVTLEQLKHCLFFNKFLKEG